MRVPHRLPHHHHSSLQRNAGSGSAVAPKLSDDKRAPEKPMEFLVQQFAVDKATKWRRTYGLGNKAEMLAVVRQVRAAAATALLAVTVALKNAAAAPRFPTRRRLQTTL